VVKRCPQGGVLLPLFWSGLGLWELNNDGYHTVEYDDNIAILINMKFLQMVSEVLQKNICI
jgi:hypothetical protein